VSLANRASFNSNEPSLYSVELELGSSLVERVSSELSSVSAHLQPYHTIFDENKINFLQVLKDVRVSDGYASNISRCVRLKECIIAGLKIHDNHILMQQFLPITLCGNLSDNIVRPIVELSAFVQGICSTTLI
jgi:hypothetical protein